MTTVLPCLERSGSYAQRLEGLPALKAPYVDQVPRGLEANLAYRERVLELSRKNKAVRADLWRMCARDPLFWLNTFVWTFDPRLSSPRVPFIAYPYQERVFHALLYCKGVLPGTEAQDVLVEKSRDMGASWLCILADLWCWQFRSDLTFLWVSRKEDLVDKTGDPKSLFWKIDFVLNHYPGWLKPRYARKKLHIRNLETGGTIDGESTTGDVARGDRRTSILLDEFASVEEGRKVLSATGDATNCRVFNSTPKGTGNAFYLMRESGILRISLHWTLHPLKAQGLYYDEKGKARSTWYDRECKRRASRLEIAQELDLDYLASGAQFFEQEMLDRIQSMDVRPPSYRGELRFDPVTCKPERFVEDQRGRLALWCRLDGRGRPPRDRNYAIGVDTSAGSDASNSVITVGDVRTGEKVAEFAAIRVLPHDLASIAVAIAHWFGGETGEAFMVWEEGGPGTIFGRTVIDLGWRNCYYRTDESSLRRKVSDKPGWYNSKSNKLALLGEFRRALASGSFTERSLQSVQEAREYVYLPDGSVGYGGLHNVEDPSGAKHNHGDRVIADALCWIGMKHTAKPRPAEPKRPAHCFYARRKAYERKRKAAASW